MKFYKISHVSPVPNAGLRNGRRGDVINGARVVHDIIPGNYSIDVWDPGRRWPDLMHSLDCMLWSERVVRAFHEAGLSGVEFYPQKLRMVDSKSLQKLPDPRYHWAHALAGVPAVPHDRDRADAISGAVFDPATIDLGQVWPFKIDPRTGFYDLSKGGMRLWKFDFSQWRGADLFLHLHGPHPLPLLHRAVQGFGGVPQVHQLPLHRRPQSRGKLVLRITLLKARTA